MKNFDYSHVPDNLKAIVKPIHDIAHQMRDFLGDSEYCEKGLHKLLEARNCFVQAKWDKDYEGK